MRLTTCDKVLMLTDKVPRGTHGQSVSGRVLLWRDPHIRLTTVLRRIAHPSMPKNTPSEMLDYTFGLVCLIFLILGFVTTRRRSRYSLPRSAWVAHRWECVSDPQNAFMDNVLASSRAVWQYHPSFDIRTKLHCAQFCGCDL